MNTNTFRAGSALALKAFCLCMLLASCTSLRENPTTAVSYAEKTFRLESKGGCADIEKGCAYYEVIYPEFTGLAPDLVSTIDNHIARGLAAEDVEAAGDMNAVASNFIENYEKFKREFADVSSGGWYNKARVRVELLTDTLISLSITEEYYAGGAHGGGGVLFINIDPRDGSDVRLEEIYSAGFEERFRVLGEQKFRASRSIADTTALLSAGFEFRDNRFHLNDNYGFTPEGIIFYYNSYEIAPYALGPTTIVLPYEELKTR